MNPPTALHRITRIVYIFGANRQYYTIAPQATALTIARRLANFQSLSAYADWDRRSRRPAGRPAPAIYVAEAGPGLARMG